MRHKTKENASFPFGGGVLKRGSRYLEVTVNPWPSAHFTLVSDSTCVLDQKLPMHSFFISGHIERREAAGGGVLY